MIKDKKAIFSLEEESKLSRFGVNYIQWDFDSFETKEFRLQADLSKFLKLMTYKKYPRYLNKVENYKFKYTYVNIQFNTQKSSTVASKICLLNLNLTNYIADGTDFVQFSISVFDKPRELKEKISEISNNELLKSNSFLIRLEEKESYIYGDEILIDFEPVYNCLIKGQTLKIICKRKDTGNDQDLNIKFWPGLNQDFNQKLINRNQSCPSDVIPKHLFDLNERVEIKINSMMNMGSILKLLDTEEYAKFLSKFTVDYLYRER